MYIKPLFSDGTASNKKNPSDSVVSFDYTSSTNSHDLYTFLNYPNHISTVHYNVQSIRYKLDLLLAEFSQFDIISFTETIGASSGNMTRVITLHLEIILMV